MTKQKKIILLAISIIVLFMGIGYAALGSVPLTINGSASATANPDNFKVFFTNENTTTSPALSDGVGVTVTTAAESDEATVTFAGLKKENDTQYAILEVKNGSTLNISAKSVTATATTAKDGSTTGFTNLETIDSYIQITTERCNSDGSATVAANTALDKDAVTYIKVTATLIKETPVNDIINKYSVSIVAEPEDPA